MSEPTFYGGATSLLNPNDHVGTLVEERYDKRNGSTYVFEWSGRETEIRAEAVYQAALGRAVSIRNPANGETWGLSVTTSGADENPTSEPLTDRWSMHWNYVEKSIWSNPLILAELRKVRGLDAAHTVAQLKNDMIKLARGEELSATGATEEVGDDVTITFEILHDLCVNLGMDSEIITLLINDLLDGVETRTVSQCVIRRTVVVPSNTTYRVSSANVGRMLSNLDGEGLPADQVFSEPLPDGGYWEKMRPEIDQTGSDRWTITQEYWWAEDFSELNFGVAV